MAFLFSSPFLSSSCNPFTPHHSSSPLLPSLCICSALLFCPLLSFFIHSNLPPFCTFLSFVVSLAPLFTPLSSFSQHRAMEDIDCWPLCFCFDAIYGYTSQTSQNSEICLILYRQCHRLYWGLRWCYVFNRRSHMGSYYSICKKSARLFSVISHRISPCTTKRKHWSLCEKWVSAL